MKEIVTVKYKTKRNHCNCCGQELMKPETSHEREFRISKESCLEWLDKEDWKTETEDASEFQGITEEFVYETISFFATRSDTELLIDNSEIEKVKQFILDKVIA